MPVYEYECTACGHPVEVMHSYTAPGPQACERCGAPMRKLLSTPAIVFKGSGWAKKDQRDKVHASTTAAAKTATEAAAGTAPAAGAAATTGEGAGATAPAASGTSTTAAPTPAAATTPTSSAPSAPAAPAKTPTTSSG